MVDVELNLSEFNKVTSKFDQFVIFGNGELAEVVLCFFDRIGSLNKVQYIVDNFCVDQRNSLYQNVQVYSPDTLKEYSGALLIASFSYKEEILEQVINSYAFPEEKIVTLSFPKAMDVPEVENASWLNGVKNELYFWTKSLSTRHKIKRTCTERANELNLFDLDLLAIYNNIRLDEGTSLKVLDVGSGPVTVLGYKSDSYEIDISCIDPLANEYKKLYKDFDFNPPILPTFCAGEDIKKHFKHGEFDIVYSCNALDHSADPLGIICNMCEVTKSGGLIYINVFENEAEHANYDGLHQWNFFVDDDNRLILWNKERKYNLTSMLIDYGVLTVNFDKTKDRQVHFYIVRS